MGGYASGFLVEGTYLRFESDPVKRVYVYAFRGAKGHDAVGIEHHTRMIALKLLAEVG